MALYNAGLHPLEPGNGVRDYQHAKRLFLDDNYRLAPKQSFLYYVSINVDDNVINNLLGTGVSSQSLTDQFETGMLVKAIELPKFTIETKTLNAYNRKNINQNKISYDPVTITFHDDSADVITNFWNDYYTYYYRDSDHNAQFYRRDHKYVQRPYDQSRNDFGYTIRNKGLASFLRNIQIFSLHGKRFTEYMLINPYITSWRHGEHRSADGTAIMENVMTVAYEGVKYFTGWINPVDVNGFSLLHYDNTPSPISDSTTNINTDSGLLGALAGASTDLSASRRDNGPNGVGILGTVISAQRAIKNLKNANLGSVVNKTIGQIGVSILGGAVNGALNSIFVPTASGVGYTGVNNTGTTNLPGMNGQIFGMPTLAGPASPMYSTPGYAGGVISNGSLMGITNAIGVNVSKAVQPVFQTSGTNGTIAVGAQTGQPVAGQSTAVLLDPTTGEVIPGSSFAVPTSGNGGYVSSDPSVNLTQVLTNTDTEGNTTRVYYYKNGDQVTFVSNATTGETVTNEYLTGASVPTVTSNPTSQVRTVTDPNTGITRVVGNSMSAQITNSITGLTGLAVGGYAGYATGSAVSKALGGGVVGQIAGGASGLVVGQVTGTLVNNGLQAIINSASSGISQVYDSVSGQVKNVAGQIFGSGSPSFADPAINLVESQLNSDGSTVSTYWDGSIVYRDSSGSVLSSVPGTNTADTSIGWGSGIPGYNQDAAGSTSSLFTTTDGNGIPVPAINYGGSLDADAGLIGPDPSQSFTNIGSFTTDVGLG